MVAVTNSANEIIMGSKDSYYISKIFTLNLKCKHFILKFKFYNFSIKPTTFN